MTAPRTTVYIEDEIDRLNDAAEKFGEMLADDLNQIFTDELIKVLTRVGADCAELNREERRKQKELRKAIRADLRFLNSWDLQEIAERVKQLKENKRK